MTLKYPTQHTGLQHINAQEHNGKHNKLAPPVQRVDYASKNTKSQNTTENHRIETTSEGTNAGKCEMPNYIEFKTNKKQPTTTYTQIQSDPIWTDIIIRVYVRYRNLRRRE